MFKLRWQDYFSSSKTESCFDSEESLWAELKSLDSYVWDQFCQGMGGMGFQAIWLEIETPDGRTIRPQFLQDVNLNFYQNP